MVSLGWISMEKSTGNYYVFPTSNSGMVTKSMRNCRIEGSSICLSMYIYICIYIYIIYIYILYIYTYSKKGGSKPTRIWIEPTCGFTPETCSNEMVERLKISPTKSQDVELWKPPVRRRKVYPLDPLDLRNQLLTSPDGPPTWNSWIWSTAISHSSNFLVMSQPEVTTPLSKISVIATPRILPDHVHLARMGATRKAMVYYNIMKSHEIQWNPIESPQVSS